MAHTTDYFGQTQERNRAIMEDRYRYSNSSYSTSASDRFFEKQAERILQEKDKSEWRRP